MNLDIIWPIAIATWLLLGAIGFAYFERYAFKHNATTLSRWVWKISEAWPPLVFALGLALGLLQGGLAVHFWWHWCPALDLGVG